MRLLLFESNTPFGAGRRDFLRVADHVVDWCPRLSEAVALREEPYDMLLVDSQLPDGSGVDWLRLAAAYREGYASAHRERARCAERPHPRTRQRCR